MYRRWTPLLLLAPALCAQSGTVTTVLGSFPSGEGGPALQAALIDPGRMALDQEGNLIVVGYCRVWKVTTGGAVLVVAGTGLCGFSGDAGPAVLARLRTNSGSGVAVDEGGNLLVADSSNHRIRRISLSGIISTTAGTGAARSGGDGGPASAAQLNQPEGLALDRSGALLVAERNGHRVRRIGPDGRITTFAGDGNPGFAGDGGPAVAARLWEPTDLAFDPAGSLYVAEVDGNRVRKVTPEGVITTAAGTGIRGFTGDGGPAIAANLDGPYGVAVDAQGLLYIATTGRIRRVDSAGLIRTVAGGATGTVGYSGDGGPAASAQLGLVSGLLFDRSGNLYVGSIYQRVRRIDAAGIITAFAGVEAAAGGTGPLVFARAVFPRDVAFDPAGNLYFVESSVRQVRRITPEGRVQLVASDISDPHGVATDLSGNVFVSHTADIVTRFSPAGQQTRAAGTPQAQAFGGDGGPAISAVFNNLGVPVVDAAGSLYIPDAGNHRLRRVSPDGIVRTIAGTGEAGFAGDNGPATAARLNLPQCAAVDRQGNVFICDTNNHRVRRINAAGIITTVVGDGRSAFSGDGGPATAAGVPSPRKVVVDESGNLYIASSNRIRRVTARGIITTVAGNGVAGFSGDGGPAVQASFNNILGFAVDPNGNLYIADRDNHRIRRVQGAVPFAVQPQVLVFAYALGAPAATQALVISTPDGESRPFRVTANVPWLAASPASGVVSAPLTLTLAVTANPAGLSKGSYFARLSVTNPDTNERTEAPVTMTISGTPQQLKLSQTGLTFAVVQSGAAPPERSFRVLNTGIGAMDWTASASTLAGGPGWLTTTPPSGRTAAGATAPSVAVRANPQGLAPGAYFGQITINAPGVDNSPQSATVVLSVLPADQPPGPVVDPLGLLVTDSTAQSVLVANVSGRAVSFSTSTSFPDGRNWFSHSPASGTVQPGQSASVVVRPNLTGVPAGVYRGELRLRFQPDNITTTVTALLVVPLGATPGQGVVAQTACTAQRLLPVFRQPGAGFQVTAGWPAPVEVQISDDCGRPVTAARVVASSSNNDPPLALTSSGEGRWTGTWASRNPRASGVNLTVDAETLQPRLAGQTRITGGVRDNPDQPLVTPGGVVNAASFQPASPLAPGSYISVFGSKLAREFRVAERLPLPPELGGTTAAVAGRPLPLHFASDGQLNAILPYGIADSTTHQLIVRRGATLAVPEPLLVAAAQPAVFTVDGSGRGQGHIYGVAEDGRLVLAGPDRPVRPGEVVVVYATGLGPVTTPVASGGAAPSSPLALVEGQVRVTIQDKDARVLFAGLAPGFAGLYQLNVETPETVTPAAAAGLVVTVNGSPSLPVTMTVGERGTGQ